MTAAIRRIALKQAGRQLALQQFNVHFDVGAIWRKELLASLGSQARVNSRQDDIANGNLPSTLVLLDSGRQKVLLDDSRALPRGEEAHLAEISLIGKVQLRPEADNLAVQDDGARIISTVTVKQRKTNVDDNAVQGLICYDGV